ncbi:MULTISPECIES: PEP-utilizing enzyme [unclassified Frankia]|uniref:PEP-utilizing enzyme n=1 Tax=unclassified Frankia TaxID=2632575 RepID=UPI001EF489B2|nr:MULTISPECIES: PEP-utilizing enzyme [unclassified Frankia]
MSGVDTDVHPFFRFYSAGNFGEVAPQRLSPMSWSLVGEPMERATRVFSRRVWGRCAWAEGSCYVFVGYFGCRPYHNLSSYCALADSIPGVEASDVTAAYFEDIEPPPGIAGVTVPWWARARAPGRVLLELAGTGPRLRLLEARVAELERDARRTAGGGADTAGMLALVLERARAVLVDAWSVHILSTAGLVPARVALRRALRRLVRHGDEVELWLSRPRELVWRRLHAAALAGPDGSGDFLASSFYEVADGHAPWASYAVRQQVVTGTAEDRVDVLDPGVAAVEMLGEHNRRIVTALSSTVGETMAAREHSKSLVMRTLHVFRRVLPRWAVVRGVPDHAWPYLTVAEICGTGRLDVLERRWDDRREACEKALATEMPEHLDLRDPASPRPWLGRGVRPAKGVSPGRATGLVIHPDISDISDIPAEPVVLACVSADADVAPLLPFVSAVVTERGSELSHIAILSREYGIPCVVGHQSAAAIPTGTFMTVDGTSGEVRVHER